MSIKERIQKVTYRIGGIALHLFETRDPKGQAAKERLEAEILPQVGKVPISELEQRIGADKFDYTGYSDSAFYDRPKSKSQLERRNRRREKRIKHLLQSDK